jgi:hypothetical protein
MVYFIFLAFLVLGCISSVHSFQSSNQFLSSNRFITKKLFQLSASSSPNRNLDDTTRDKIENSVPRLAQFN